MSDVVNFYAPLYSNEFNETNYYNTVQDGETQELKCVIPNDGVSSATFMDVSGNPIPKGKITVTGDLTIDEFANISIGGDGVIELND